MIVSQKTTFQSTHFHIDHLLIDRDGKKLQKDLLVRVPVVYILPYTPDGHVYLEHQYRDAFGKKVLEGIAGHIAPDEDPLVGAKRELQEETGLTGKNWKQVATWDLSMNMQAKIHVFFVTDLTEGKQHLDDDEVIETVKMPIEDALAKVSSGELTAASHIAALLLFEKLRKEGKL